MLFGLVSLARLIAECMVNTVRSRHALTVPVASCLRTNAGDGTIRCTFTSVQVKHAIGDRHISGKTMWPDRSPRASGKLTELQDQALFNIRMESQWSFSASALVLRDFVYYSTASIGHSRFTNPDSSSLSPKRSLPLATPTFDAMIQLRYPVPDTDNTYALLDPVPSVCKPVVKRTFQLYLKEELKRHRSHSGILVHRAEARYDTAFWNEATQSAVLSQESDVNAQGCIRGGSWR